MTCRWIVPIALTCFSLMSVDDVDAAQTAKHKQRPNFVLLLADDLGWGDVGYNRNPDVQTPVLDEIARTGVRFDRFYAAANVCSPTRGSFVTGRTPVRYGVFSWGWSLRPEEITIAEALKPAGYATGHFGKWHLGTLHAKSATSPGAQGFNEWSSSPNFYENDPLFSRRGTVVATKGESSEVTVDAALEFIEGAAKRDEPFLAVVWFGNPHGPHQALPELREPYAAHDPKMQNYWGEITGIDRAVGKLRTRLRELNLADDTLLWFTSDNGATDPGSTGGLRGKKGSNWEGGLRVPSLIEWPSQVKRPTVVSVPCCSVDILPTVLAAAGVEHPQPARPLDGENIWPIVVGERSERTQSLGFWTYPNKGKGKSSRDLLITLRKQSEDGTADSLPPLNDDERASFAERFPTDALPGQAAWIDGRFKLHRLGGAKPDVAATYQLYDLIDDEKETTDLAAAQPERVSTMTKALEQWQRSVLNSLNGGDDAK